MRARRPARSACRPSRSSRSWPRSVRWRGSSGCGPAAPLPVVSEVHPGQRLLRLELAVELAAPVVDLDPEGEVGAPCVEEAPAELLLPGEAARAVRPDLAVGDVRADREPVDEGERVEPQGGRAPEAVLV